MILIPYEKCIKYNEFNLPSEDYTEELDKAVDKLIKANPRHYDRFPEHISLLEKELPNVFNECALKAIYENSGKAHKELALVLVDCYFYNKEGLECSFWAEV